MARTDASPDRGSGGGGPQHDSTLHAIEQAIEQAGPRDPGLMRALLQARELFPTDPAGAQRLLDDILNAEVLLGIGRGFVEVAAAPLEHSGRGGGDASIDVGRTSSGRTISNSSAGGTEDAALAAYSGGTGDGSGGLQVAGGAGGPASGIKLKDWQGVLCDLLSYAKNDMHRMKQKLAYAVRLSQQNLLARSTIVPLELQRVMDTTRSTPQLQAELRNLVLEFSRPLFRNCTRCCARRLVRRNPVPPHNRFSCGHSCCVFPVRSCKPGGWDEGDDWEALFPRALLEVASSAQGVQPRKLRRLDELAEDTTQVLGPTYSDSPIPTGSGADAGPGSYSGRAGAVAKRTASTGRAQQQKRGSQVLDAEGFDGGDDYIGPPPQAVRRLEGPGSPAVAAAAMAGPDPDDDPLVGPPSLKPWLHSFGRAGEATGMQLLAQGPMLFDGGDLAQQGQPESHGDKRHVGQVHGAHNAMTMVLAADGGRLRLVPDVHSLPAAGGTPPSGKAYSGPPRLAVQPIALHQQMMMKVGTAAQQQQRIEQDGTQQARRGSASEATISGSIGGARVWGRGAGSSQEGAAGGPPGSGQPPPQLLRLGLGAQTQADRDVGESRPQGRGSDDATDFTAGAGRGGGGVSDYGPPLKLGLGSAGGAGGGDSSGSGRAQGTLLMPSWGTMRTRDGPSPSDSSGLAATRSRMTTAGTPPPLLGPPPDQLQQLQNQVDIHHHLRLMALHQQVLLQHHLLQQQPMRAQRQPRVVRLSNGQLAAAMGPAESDGPLNELGTLPELARYRPSPSAPGFGPEEQGEVVILPDGRRALVLPARAPFEVSVPVQATAVQALPYMGGGGGRGLHGAAQSELATVSLGRAPVDDFVGEEPRGGSAGWATQAAASERQEATALGMYGSTSNLGTRVDDAQSGDADQQRFQFQQLQGERHQEQLPAEQGHQQQQQQQRQPQQPQQQLQQPQQQQQPQQDQEQQRRRVRCASHIAAPEPQPARGAASGGNPEAAAAPAQQRWRPAVAVTATAGRGKPVGPGLMPVAGVPGGSCASSLSTVLLVGSPSATMPAAAAAAVGTSGAVAPTPRVMRTQDGRVFLVEPVQLQDGPRDGTTVSGGDGGAGRFAPQADTSLLVAAAPAVPPAMPLALPAGGLAANMNIVTEPAVSNQTAMAHSMPPLLRPMMRRQMPAASDSTGSGATHGPAVHMHGTAAAAGANRSGSAPSSSISSGVPMDSAVLGTMPMAASWGAGGHGHSHGVRRLLLQPISLTANDLGLDARELPRVQTGPVVQLQPPAGRAAAAAAAAGGSGMVPGLCLARHTGPALLELTATQLIAEEPAAAVPAGTAALGMLGQEEPVAAALGGVVVKEEPSPEGDKGPRISQGAAVFPGPLSRPLPAPMTDEELQSAAPETWQSYLHSVLSLAALPCQLEALPAPGFGDKPAFLWHSQQADVQTVEWSSRIILRGSGSSDSRGSIRGIALHVPEDVELLSVCADLPPELLPLMPPVMAVSEVRLRKDILVTVMKARPLMLWLSPDSVPEQREALARLALMKIGIVVHVDEDTDFVMSPQEIEGSLLLVGVVLQRSPTPLDLGCEAQAQGSELQAGADAAAAAAAGAAAVSPAAVGSDIALPASAYVGVAEVASAANQPRATRLIVTAEVPAL